MRKVLLSIIAIILLLAFAALALAAVLSIYVDGKQVPMAPDATFIYSYQDECGQDFSTNYFMDVPPQLIAGRVFVPLRVAANYWDAEVFWQNPVVSLNFDDISLTLTVGSTTAQKNESRLILEAAPYIKDGRIMVPLRFISEAFGCEVNYIGGNVYITTPSLHIDGKKVVAVQSWARMTMGGILQECKTNICIEKLYQFLKNSCGNEIPEPEYYGENLNLDIHTFYYMNWEISFMATEGVEGDVIQRFKIFSRMNDDPDWENPVWQGTDWGKWLVYDVTQDKWHQVIDNNWARYTGAVVNVDDFEKYFLERSGLGRWDVIFNNVV
jgi:hypothetical protein